MTDLLASADFFQRRFQLGALAGAEMPVSEGLLYYVALDTAQQRLYCSCPFFPKPCVHALALSALYQRAGNDAFPESDEEVPWLPALLAGRAGTTARSGIRPEQRAAAQQKTRFERLERAASGFEDLETWLGDTVRRGLATLLSEDPRAFDYIAARAADASMTSLSRQLRLLTKVSAEHPDWSGPVADVLAQIYLAIRAFRKREALPDALLHDLQNFIGIALKKDDVLGSGERITDTWAVLGNHLEVLEDKLSVRRTWLLGAKSGRMALLLDFTFGGGGFAPGFEPGSIQQGALVFYPSAFPQRALPVDEIHPLAKKVEKMPGHADFDHFLNAYAAALAAQPWLPHYAAVVLQVLPGKDKKQAFFLSDSRGKALPLQVSERNGWALIALSGGGPIQVFGKWDGQQFLPLSAVAEERLVAFG